MKIGLLLPSVYMGRKYSNKIFAPKDLFLNLADGLAERGHEVYVYSSPDTKTKAHLIPGEGDLIEQDFLSPRFRALDRIAKLKNAHVATRIEYEIDLTIKAYLQAKEKKVEIMHSYHDFVAHYVNRAIPIKTVYTIHDPRPRKEHLEYWRFKNFQKDKYIFISKSQLRNFRKLIRCVGIVYHGINIGKFTFSEKGGEYFAFLGRYVKEKGVVEAIEAAKSVGMTLKMIGENAYRRLPYYKEKVLPQIKKGVIEDETFLAEADRVVFLKNARALLFPIRWEEPFGLVMIEAMACGTPVAAFARGSVPEVLVDGETGFIVNPSSHDIRGNFIIKKTGVEGLREAVKKIYAMPQDKYQKMRQACRAHVEKNFTVERMVDDYEEIYRNILKR